MQGVVGSSPISSTIFFAFFLFVIYGLSMVSRCPWVNLKNEKYIAYHDREWCVPKHDDHELYELLILESFQAGLSWECVLNRREFFRRAYDNFDIDKIENYTDIDIARLMSNSGIIRNKLKIQASITNSRIFKEIQQEFGSFDKYIWGFSDNKIIREDCTKYTHSELSDKVSKDLRRRGMKYVGTTIIYSYLQAIGIINGHTEGCFCS